MQQLQEYMHAEDFNYFELRCRDEHLLNAVEKQDLKTSSCFASHEINLSDDLQTIFGRFHRSCIQRKIRRAERENVQYEESNSDEAIRKFYSLLIKTRQRHGVPPQPLSWFFNLRDAWGQDFKVRIATQSGRAIASIITILHKQCLTYKYGCSDARFHKFGAMAFLFWHSIQDAKRQGATKLDLGRSELDNQGLIAFKNHLGADSSRLIYYRYPTTGAFKLSLARTQFVSSFWRYLPASVLRVAGKLLYRHIG